MILAFISFSLGLMKSCQLDPGQVSCHPQHRTLAASWLHPSISSSPAPPVLDGVPLTRQEMAMIGSSRLLAPPMPSPPPPSSPLLEQEEHKSVSREGSVVTSISGSVRRRKKKVREAVIMDQPIMDSEETTIKVDVEVTARPSTSNVYSEELLEALKKSQSVESYGGENRLEELLGITDKTPHKDPETEKLEEISREGQKVECANVLVSEIKKDPDSIEKMEPDGEPEKSATCDVSSGGIYGTRDERETSPQVRNPY